MSTEPESTTAPAERNDCTALTGHLPGQDHRWQECPTYHEDDK